MRHGDAQDRGRTRRLVRFCGMLLGTARLPDGAGRVQALVALQVDHRGDRPNPRMVLFPALCWGNSFQPVSLRFGTHARLDERFQGSGDEQERWELRRAGGGPERARRRRPAVLLHEDQRTLGEHQLHHGRREEREADFKHSLERARLRIHVHGARQVRTRAHLDKIPFGIPQARGQMAVIEARGFETHCGRRDEALQPPQGSERTRGIHTRRPFQVVREARQEQNVDRG